jgi:catechol 2,3-dioxygenase-like lactoylglutathione lyase family enzyme
VTQRIEMLIDSFQQGHLSRRELVATLAMLASAAPSPGAGSSLRAAALNHVSLAVSDVERSRQFYQKVFDLPVVSKQAGGLNLGVGPQSFLGLYSIAQVSPRIHHVCLAMDDFTPDGAVQALAKQSVKGTIRDRDGVKELYFQDPDGITVQLQGVDYRG